jgi:hypothetical protein
MSDKSIFAWSQVGPKERDHTDLLLDLRHFVTTDFVPVSAGRDSKGGTR